jgi:hypothetical protein
MSSLASLLCCADNATRLSKIIAVERKDAIMAKHISILVIQVKGNGSEDSGNVATYRQAQIRTIMGVWTISGRGKPATGVHGASWSLVFWVSRECRISEEIETASCSIRLQEESSIRPRSHDHIGAISKIICA